MMDYSKSLLSWKRLEEQNSNGLRQSPALSELDCEGIAESVMQRFEACYDCMWKVLTKYLIEELALPGLVCFGY